MSTPPDDLVRAWLEAAEDLGIDVTAPYAVGDQTFGALIAGFGAGRGTVVDWQGSDNTTADLAAAGYYLSIVSPQAYGVYARDLFRETLDDWGWHGDPQHQPPWYTGAPD
jgi:hypothetical protein